MPSDDERRDDSDIEMPDWLRESDADPVEFNLPDDFDEVDDPEEDQIPSLTAGVPAPNVSSVWVTADERSSAANALPPASDRLQRSAAYRGIAAVIFIAAVVALVLYVWSVW